VLQRHIDEKHEGDDENVGFKMKVMNSFKNDPLGRQCTESVIIAGIDPTKKINNKEEWNLPGNIGPEYVKDGKIIPKKTRKNKDAKIIKPKDNQVKKYKHKKNIDKNSQEGVAAEETAKVSEDGHSVDNAPKISPKQQQQQRQEDQEVAPKISISNNSSDKRRAAVKMHEDVHGVVEKKNNGKTTSGEQQQQQQQQCEDQEVAPKISNSIKFCDIIERSRKETDGRSDRTRLAQATNLENTEFYSHNKRDSTDPIKLKDTDCGSSIFTNNTNVRKTALAVTNDSDNPNKLDNLTTAKFIHISDSNNDDKFNKETEKVSKIKDWDFLKNSQKEALKQIKLRKKQSKLGKGKTLKKLPIPPNQKLLQHFGYELRSKREQSKEDFLTKVVGTGHTGAVEEGQQSETYVL
jgi:hypothetical protein